MKRIILSILGLMLVGAVLAQEPAPSADTKPPAQEKGEFSGNFQTNNQAYVRDDRIGANTTQYKHELSSTDAWLFLNYKIKGFNFMLRYDLFNNSPLFNPQQAYSNQGIGFWQINKDVDRFNFTIGYFYDQFGTGMVFRAYEDRNIGIDFAIAGARVIYHATEHTTLKAFTGKQKFRFDYREPIIKGVNLEHQFVFNDEFNSEIGTSLVNRTIDQSGMNAIAATINSYPDTSMRFNPKYNVFAANIYNALNYKNFTLFLEYDYKTKEAIMDQNNILVNKGGNIYYASLSYSTKGVGINAQFKRIESFPLKTSPLETQPSPNNAAINYLPSLTRQNTYRLLARYNAVVQELGENAMQLELTLKPSKNTQVNINGSLVTTLQGLTATKGFVWDTTTRLFRELYVDASHKFSKQFKMLIGIQLIGYNQAVFEAKAAPFVEAITPFGEFTYKINRTNSLRFEWQYMHNKQDLGSFVNGLLEFNMAPHWSFAAGDLLNIQQGYLNNEKITGEKFEDIHYFNFFAAYTYKATRVTAGYLKQPQGVNCTGGVCRVEPAFSGARVTLSTNF